MALVLFLAAVLWGIGAAMGTPRRLRWSMIGLLWLAVVALHLVLPEGHTLRMATGESPALWLMLGGAAALVLIYRAGLRYLRARVVEKEPVTPPPRPGSFSDAELDRYARHMVL